MLRRYAKIVFFTIAFLMTFTENCMITKQAGQLIEQQALADHGDSIIVSCNDNTITFETICTQQMLGISRISFYRQANPNKTFQFKQWSHWILAIISLNSIRLLNLHTEDRTISICKLCFKNIILNYIHDKDGAK